VFLPVEIAFIFPFSLFFLIFLHL